MYSSIVQCKNTYAQARSKKILQDLSGFIKQAEKKGKKLVLLLIDIDDLGYTNNVSGREAGDCVICAAESILSENVSGTVHAYRLEGDLFAVIGENISSRTVVHGLCQHIFLGFSRHRISISMGISMYPAHDREPSFLLRDADLALRYAKHNFKGNYYMYTPEMYTCFMQEMQVQQHVTSALKNDEFVLYYQPQYYIGSHELRGFEALIRHNDPLAGLQSPASFIPAAEKSNLINDIGEWVMENALKNLLELQNGTGFDGIISVNVSPKQLLAPLFLTQFKRLLRKYRVNDPSRIELEITESSFIHDAPRAVAVLDGIRKTGAKISIDDFGSGYSSLYILSMLPVDTIKIDKSFVDTITDEHCINNEIIKAVTGVSRKAGIETIAEGVETDQQLAFLSGVSCSCLQGFLWGKPMPFADCMKL